MSIQITETITRTMKITLPADLVQDLIRQAAMEAAGVSGGAGITISMGSPVEPAFVLLQVEGAQPIKPLQAAPSVARIAAPKLQAKRTARPIPNAWTKAEDDKIVALAKATPNASRRAISIAAAKVVSGRTPSAIEARLKTKLELVAKLAQAQAAVAKSIPTPATAEKIDTTPRSPVSISAELAAHIKALPKVEGWTLADDAELMDRVTKNQNTTVIGAGMEREPAFIIQRFDRLLDRKKGGAVSYGRQVMAAALAELAAIAKEAAQ